MFARLLLVPLVLILSLPVAVRADDAIPPETLAAVKKATVFVQTTGANWKGSGSGFVVAIQKDNLLIATNHHVIGDHDKDRKDRMTPQELIRSFKAVSVNVVFDPGLKTEQSIKADIIAADPDIDLAILRVAKPKAGAPAPIEIPTGLKLTETMPVYVFGFPFGQALSTSKGAPAVTIGKGSVSSLRLDDTGTLAMVQIDGALNPGNSGGPVVDAKGQLIGVAVATIKSGQGIGLAVPGAELGRIMKGRVGGIHTIMAQTAPNKITVHVEAEVLDPTAAVRGVTLRYLAIGRGLQKPPLGETLAGRVGMKSIPLKISNGIATGDISVDANLSGLFVQAVPDGDSSKTGATEVFDVALVPGGAFAGGAIGGPLGGGSGGGRDSAPPEPENVGPMPNGWKEYRPKDNTFSVWIPAQARAQRERERTTSVRGVRLRSNTLTVEMANGMAFIAQEIIVLNGLGGGGGGGANQRAEAEELLRDMIVSEINGRVTQERNVKTGDTPGKEYRIEAGRAVLKVRIFVAGKVLVVLQSLGNREQIESAPVTTFLTSFKLAPGGAPPMAGPAPGNPFGPGPGTQPGIIPPNRPGPGVPGMPGNPFAPAPGQFPGNNVAAERKSKILGGFNDPEFADEAAKGGYLVGAEVGLGQFFNNAVIHAIRPVFMVGGQEVGGNWHGPPQGKQLVRVGAKPGYAVGAITVKAGLGVDGFSMTFMKVANGKLDPTDSYESPWIGGPGGGAPEKLGGNGWLLVGLVGRAKNDAMTGLGVLYPEVANTAPAPGLTPGAPQFPGRPGGFPENPGGFAGNPQPQVPVQPVIGEAANNEPFTPAPPMNANNPTPAPVIPEINAPSGSSNSSTSTPAPASSGSRLPIILGVIAGVLGLVFAGVGIVIMTKNQGKKRRVPRRRSLRDDDDDDYDDRRSSRSSRRR